MNLTNDFHIRMVGAQDGFRIPVLKAKINDTNCLMTVKIEGDQQNYLDISRCMNLSARFITKTIALSFPLLIYLDLSYTNADDLTLFFTHCPHLKTLNCAGLELLEPHLKGIQKLGNLEVLSLRGSNIEDISAVEGLLCLRSLDCGMMKIHKVQNALTKKDRLEELLFDFTTFSNYECISDIMDEFTNLTSLRLLNVNGSELVEEMVFIKDIFASQPFYLEPKDRRYIFLQAIIENKVSDAYHFVTSGQDLNVKIEKSDEKWLSSIWIKRCYYQKAKIQTPYFIFNPVDSMQEDDQPQKKRIAAYEHFPNALHLALFFNSFECVQMLLECGANIDEEVYISDVLYEKTQQVLYEHYSMTGDENNAGGPRKLASMFLMSSDTSKNLLTEGLKRDALLGGGKSGSTNEKKDGENDEENKKEDDSSKDQNSKKFLMKKLYTVKEYVNYLYYKNVHRFTEDLIAKKVSNWKSICDRFRKRLLYLIDTYDPNNVNMTVQMLRGNDSFNVLSPEEMDSRKTFAINMEFSSKSTSMLVTDFNASAELKPDVLSKPVDDGVNIGKITTINHDNNTNDPSLSKSNNRLPRTVSFGMDTTFQIPNKEDLKQVDPGSPNINNINMDNFKPEDLPILKAMKFANQNQSQPQGSQSEASSSVGSFSSVDGEDDWLSSNKPKILGRKQRLFPWHEHGLIVKILGPPKVYEIHEEITPEQEEANSWMIMTSDKGKDKKDKTENSKNAALLALQQQQKQQGSKPKAAKRQTKIDKELAELEKWSTTNAMNNNNTKKSGAFSRKFEFKEVSVLGKKSFWLESRRKTIEEAVIKREESEIYPPVKHVPLMAKKKMFLETLKYRLEKAKYGESLK